MEVSRREFLRLLAAAAGASALLAGGLGGFLAGCRKQEVSPTVATVASGTPTASSTTASTLVPTTVAAGPGRGRALRIGLVSSYTGPLALFGKADDWCVEFTTSALPYGVLCGDGTLHHLEFVRWDCRSQAERAASGAAHLVTAAEADVLLCSGDAEVVNAVADQAEQLLCPCLCNLVEWHGFASRKGASDRALRFSYAHAWAVEDVAADLLQMWEQVSTNRKVGLVVAGDEEGQLWADGSFPIWRTIVQAGYELVAPEPFSPGAQDFNAHISELQKAGCEICCVLSSSSDFLSFWRQALGLDYHPKVVTAGRALFFPQTVAALGSAAHLLTSETLWLPSWPFVESVSGKTCRQLADDYMQRTGELWTPALAQLARLEWAIDVFKRTTDVDSEREFVRRVLETRLSTCLGPIDFTEKVAAGGPDGGGLIRPQRVADTVYKAPVAGVQWEVAEPVLVEARLVSAANYPELEVDGKIRRIEYGG